MKNAFFDNGRKYFFLVLYAFDVIAFVLSARIVSIIFDFSLRNHFYFRYFLFMLFVVIFMYSTNKLYMNKRSPFDDTDFTSIIQSNATAFVSLYLFIIIFNPYDRLLIIITLATLIIAMAMTTIFRIALNISVGIARNRGYDIKRALYFGEADDELIEKLKDKSLGYNLIRATHSKKVLEKYLEKADTVFLKMESIDDNLLEIMIRNDHVDWKIISSLLNLVIEPVAFDEFKDYPIINLKRKDKTRSYSIIKGVIDFALSLSALILLAPLFLLVALLIKITMPGPVFYRQERLGQDQKPFVLYKFRTMIVGADDKKKTLQNEVNGLFKLKNDPRITRLGRIMRRSCIDELPQLINIVRGEMSLVGPRPHLEEELPNFHGWRMARFDVKPGLTGMWQVNGRHELNFDKAVLYDVYYVRHMSLLLDISIILKTIPAIIMNKGRF